MRIFHGIVFALFGHKMYNVNKYRETMRRFAASKDRAQKRRDACLKVGATET